MKLLAVDGNSIMNRAYYGIRLLTNKEGVYTNAVYGFMTILLKMIEDVKPDAFAFAFDLKAPTFRHKMYSEYKAGRKGMPDELAVQMPIIKEILTNLGMCVLEKEGYEADDILGTLARICDESDTECVIATGDRDSFQLISEKVNVRLASTKMGKAEATIYDIDKIKEVYHATPQQIIDIKAIMGDSSDNIPGVAGIGEKGAIALIEKFGSLSYIYDNIDEIDVKDGIRAKLKASEDMAKLSYELAKINKFVPLEQTLPDLIKAEGNPSKVATILRNLEMYSILERLGLSDVASQNESHEDTPKSAPIEVLKNPNKEIALNKIKSFGKAVFVIDYGTMKSAFYTDEYVLFFDEVCDTVKDILADKSLQKITTNVKNLYKYTISNNISLENVVFDAELSAYLLNPSSNDYSLERLSAEYSIADGNLAEDCDDICKQPVILNGIYNKLYNILTEKEQLKLLGEIEIPLAEVLADMELCGFAVDKEGITKYGEWLGSEITTLQNEIYDLAGESFNINSPKQLGVVLFEKMGLPAKKKTKTGYSTNADVLEALRPAHPIIDKILHYRQLAKLKSTYADGLLKVIADDGRIHTSFNQTETRTGRISSLEPNLQNIPIRTELGSRLREYFTAREGYSLIDADYSQIELRVLAHLANDENMINAFNNGEDIHTITASQVFDMPVDMVTSQMRSRAKAVNFGIVYGIGAFSLSQDIGVSVAEAKRYIEGYLQTYSGVREFMKKAVETATEKGYSETLFNRRRLLPELSSSNKMLKSFGERVAMNMPIQGTAADIIKIAMIRVYKRLKAEGFSAKLILQVHDELIVEAPENEASRVKTLLTEEMESAVSLKVKLTADANIGHNWLVAKG